MTWQPGHERIEDLLAAGELEQVTPADSVASLLLEDAGRHPRNSRCRRRDWGLGGGLSTRLRRAAEERRQPARRPGTPCTFVVFLLFTDVPKQAPVLLL